MTIDYYTPIGTGVACRVLAQLLRDMGFPLEGVGKITFPINLPLCTTKTCLPKSLLARSSEYNSPNYPFLFSRQGSSASAKSSTLPLPHRLGPERPVQVRERDRDRDRDRDGYYSDRNELIRERERDRDRDRGYLSDHNSK